MYQKGLVNKRPEEAELPEHLEELIEIFTELIQDKEDPFEFEDLVELVQWVEYQLPPDAEPEEEG